MKLFLATLAALISPVLLFAADRPATPAKVTVLGIIGVWKNDGKTLRFGTEVKAGSVVSAEQSGVLTVGLDDAIAIYTCDQACNRTVSLANKTPVTGWAQFKATVLPIISRDSDRLISAVSRGTDVSEAVVPLNGSQVDLSSMLSDLAPGSYAARFKPLGPQGSPGSPAQFQYSHGSPALISVPGIRPGLYQVELLRPDGQPLGMEAWVLVSGPEAYGHNAEAFKQAAQVVSNWSGTADARSVRAVMRAVLESLAAR